MEVELTIADASVQQRTARILTEMVGLRPRRGSIFIYCAHRGRSRSDISPRSVALLDPSAPIYPGDSRLWMPRLIGAHPQFPEEHPTAFGSCLLTWIWPRSDPPWPDDQDVHPHYRFWCCHGDQTSVSVRGETLERVLAAERRLGHGALSLMALRAKLQMQPRS